VIGHRMHQHQGEKGPGGAGDVDDSREDLDILVAGGAIDGKVVPCRPASSSRSVPTAARWCRSRAVPAGRERTNPRSRRRLLG
jgi:hypothetical protein